MSNSNITQSETQAPDLGLMMGRRSLDRQHGRPDRHPTNVGCSLFRYTNGDLRNHTNQRPRRKVWTREANQLALHCYFRSNPTHKGYRKRMMEIWQEHSNFQTTSQILALQVRTIIKKGWLSDLEMIEILHKINYQQGNNTLPGTLNINKQNSPSQMNHQLRKMETPHNQILQNQTTQNKYYQKYKS